MMAAIAMIGDAIIKTGMTDTRSGADAEILKVADGFKNAWLTADAVTEAIEIGAIARTEK